MIVSKTAMVRWNNNTRQYYLDKGYIYTKDGELFSVKVEDIPHKSRARIVCKCDICGKEREISVAGYYKNLHEGKSYCHLCGNGLSIIKRDSARVKKSVSFLQFCLEQFGRDWKSLYWSDKNTVNPDDICKNSSKKVWIKCQNAWYHDDYSIACFAFVNGNRCPSCASRIIHPRDSFGSKVDSEIGENFISSRWSTNNIYSPYKISASGHTKIWLTCPDRKHNDYEQSLNAAIIAHFHCPYCTRERKKSYLQEKVENYITDGYGYTMLFERDCNIQCRNIRTGRILPYDIEIPSLLMVIEVNGSQHYNISSTYWQSLYKDKSPQDGLLYQQWKDKYKKDYAISNGYTYLEVPYNTELNLKYRELVDSAISAAQKSVSA